MSGGPAEDKAGTPDGAGAPQGAGAEATLVRAAQGGDRTAFDRLVRAHFGRIYSVLFRLVGNHEDAEDLGQECFVRAWGALRYYRADGSFEGWLLRIAVHLARDAGRKRARAGKLIGFEDLGGVELGFDVRAGTGSSRSGASGGGAGSDMHGMTMGGPQPDPSGPGARSEHPGVEVGRREMMRGLVRAIESLPEGLRVALVLRVLEGLEYEDVARATGVRPATVRMRVMKARRLLMRHMQPWLGAGEL